MLTYRCSCGAVIAIDADEVATIRAHFPSVAEGCAIAAEIDPNWTDAQFLAWTDGLWARGFHGLFCGPCIGE